MIFPFWQTPLPNIADLIPKAVSEPDSFIFAMCHLTRLGVLVHLYAPARCRAYLYTRMSTRFPSYTTCVTRTVMCVNIMACDCLGGLALERQWV
jgi:hypothetical protein